MSSDAHGALRLLLYCWVRQQGHAQERGEPMGDAQTTLGTRVREARIARGWNQEALAQAAGVAVNTISSLESGRRAAQPAKVAAVLEALEMDATPEPVSDIPEDVRLVTDVVAMWLTGIPAGPERAAAVLALVQHLKSPASSTLDIPDDASGAERGRGGRVDARRGGKPAVTSDVTGS